MLLSETREYTLRKTKEKVLRERHCFQSIACEVCLQAFPHSCTCPREVEDYLLYYCGMECYLQEKNLNP
mgnify:FL=1